MSVGVVKEDFDKSNEPCKVIDCVLSPVVIERLNKDAG